MLIKPLEYMGGIHFLAFLVTEMTLGMLTPQIPSMYLENSWRFGDTSKAEVTQFDVDPAGKEWVTTNHHRRSSAMGPESGVAE